MAAAAAARGALRGALGRWSAQLGSGGRRLSSGGAAAPIAMPALGATAKTRDGAVELYDQWARTYDETLRSWEYPAATRTAQLLKLHSAPPAGGSAAAAAADERPGFAALRSGALPVADAGCGTGLSGEALRAAGFTRLVGTDVSDASLDLCREKGVYQDLFSCDLECSDGPLPFADDSLAAVTCVGVLSYVHKFDKCFSEWCRVVAPGGLVVFTHRLELWDGNEDGVRSAAEACSWQKIFESEPEDYMPKNPDPKESSKRIRYLVYQVL